jgi:pimeloyl-ACP methyl ester carboxylesterase
LKLNYRTFGEGTPLVILHGLFGSSDNWQTLGKKFAEYFHVFLVDLRNHGRSPHSDEFDFDSMSEDLLELVYENQFTHLHLLGHSMGGKVGMRFAQRWPEFIDKLIVGDIGVKSYEAQNQKILAGLMDLYKNPPSNRKEASDRISGYVDSEAVKQLLLKNLYWNDGDLLWRMNVPVINQDMHHIRESLPKEISDVEALFIRGGDSDYIVDADVKGIKNLFPRSSIETIPNAGHWLHADVPDLFAARILTFLDAN